MCLNDVELYEARLISVLITKVTTLLSPASVGASQSYLFRLKQQQQKKNPLLCLYNFSFWCITLMVWP